MVRELMPFLRQYRRFFLSLFVLWGLLFLGHSWEEGLKMDAMENLSIAKHVLMSGNWKSFRYEAASYANYFNHPPLVIWIEALFFKIFGISATIARIPPALFGLGTLIGVVVWGQISSSIELGLLAGWVLLTSNRYIKFASDALLEGPLCFFLVWGVVFFLRSQEENQKSSFHNPFLLGICLAGAFLTKSIFAIILPLALALALIFKGSPLKAWLRNISGVLIGLFLVLGMWFGFGDGLHFLKNHYTAISSRVETRDWTTLLVPTRNLLTTYWPWLPFFLWSSFKMLRNRKEQSLGGCIALIMSTVVIVGFSLSGHFFEHYLTTFYPPASIVVSISLFEVLKNQFLKFEKILWGLTIAVAVALAIVPIQLRRDRAEPLATTLKEMSAVCSGQTEILISREAMDRWLAVAVTLWKTPFEVRAIDSLNVTPQPGQLLIAAQEESPSLEHWQKVPLCLSRLKLYQSKQFPYCRNQ